MILREELLEQLLHFKDTEFIRVLTGVRRSGKSYLLRMYKNHLLEHGVAEDQIFYLNFEDYSNYDLLNDRMLFEYIKNQAVGDKRIYLLFDEIQLVENWQKVLNSFRVSFDSDITVTGSNAQMLSGELATFLSGRYVEIKVYPLSFKEFLLFKGLNNLNESMIEKSFEEYITYGAFPMVVLADHKIKEIVLSGVFDTILLNDVSFRATIKEPAVLKLVSEFLASNVGQLVSSTKISNTLNSTKEKTSVPTITRYLELFQSAYLFYKANRYDIRGKSYLHNQSKYYMIDLGLRRIALGKKQDNLGNVLENLVYIELLRRGYSVDVGTLTNNKEIDFIARKLGEILYIQVAHQLPENSMRETDNLLKIPNNHEKLVITRRHEEATEIDGIPIVNVIDWLLE